MFEELRKNQYFNQVVEFLSEKRLLSQSYLVGGTVRDVFIGRSLIDLDFAIMGDSVSLAKEFAQRVGGTFVLLDEVFAVARVVKDGLTIDFSELRGDSIEFDLSERDFTINAIALELQNYSLIDPFRGTEDLKAKKIRVVKEDNLRVDPLRVLRAYRFHGSLGFEIEERTRHALTEKASLLGLTARERIKDELWKILSLDDSSKTVKLMAEDGIFKAIFKHSELYELKINLLSLRLLEEILSNPKNVFSSPRLNISDKLKATLKFTALFGFSSQAFLKELKPSKREEKFTENLLRGLTAVKKIETLIDKVRFLRDFEQILYPLLVLSISFDPLGLARAWFYRDIEEFYRKIFLKNKAKLPIISGNDLLNAGFEPSPMIGQILDRVEILALAGKISKKEDALEMARKIKTS